MLQQSVDPAADWLETEEPASQNFQNRNRFDFSNKCLNPPRSAPPRINLPPPPPNPAAPHMSLNSHRPIAIPSPIAHKIAYIYQTE